MATVNGNGADTYVVYNYVVQSNIVLVPFKVNHIYIAKYVSHKYDVMYYFQIKIGACPKFCIIIRTFPEHGDINMEVYVILIFSLMHIHIDHSQLLCKCKYIAGNCRVFIFYMIMQ